MKKLPSLTEAVEFVLGRFRDMGATPHQLATEAVKLLEDQEYLSDWYETCSRKGPSQPD